MRNYFLLYVAAIIFACSYLGTSCKKIIHSSAPTPNNVRMMAYTKITTIKMTTPVAGMPSTISENFRFYYDEANRVSKITYTGNDSFEIHKDIKFTYKGDSIFKSTLNILTNVIVEVDTFVLNSKGQIRQSLEPHYENNYEYYGNLLARNIRKSTSYYNITATDFSTYTSVNGDLLKHTNDAFLKFRFENFDHVYKNVKVLPDTVKRKDSLFLHWFVPEDYTRDNNYTPLYVYVQDTAGVKDSLWHPSLFWVNEGYHFYTENANRIGDYMQLESFTFFGKNIYQNSHLVESITARNRNAAITYAYDSDNKIIQTKVVILDSVLNKFTSVYDIQYETY